MPILIISFFAGILTVLAPCVLPLLPIILGSSLHEDKSRPYIIILALSFSIIVFSLLLKATTFFIWFDKSILTSISWTIILFFWIITIFPNLWKNISSKIWFDSKSNQILWESWKKSWILWTILVWLSLWPVFSSCSPTYAIILAVIIPISFWFWLLNLFAYVLWLWVILLAIALLWQRFTKKLRWISSPNSVFKKSLWVIFLIIGLSIITWFDKKIEASLIQRWFIWAWFVEQNFLDKIQNDIDNLDAKKTNMETKKIEIDMNNLETAYFAWGCFWCIESIMDGQTWVSEAISWYAWWTEKNPSYNEVSSWKTWYREAVKVLFDPKIISYKELVETFFRQIDPTDEWWQFADRWFHYTTAIYFTNEEQKNIVEDIIKKLDISWEFDKKIVTKIENFTTFYEAEEYHQNYAEKQSLRYKSYKIWSGRAWYIEENKDKYEELFSDTNTMNLKDKLTPLQYKVTQMWWTEMAFENEYWDNKEDWIYVDIIDWTPLFSSTNKFDSWTGWPSFTKSIDDALLEEKEDDSLYMSRTEVRSQTSNSHLGHVFNDWPEEDGWFRYCINSAALRFIPLSEMKENWYDKYLKLFE